MVHRSRRLLLLMAPLAVMAGCTPTGSRIRLIGSQALDPPGRYPNTLEFQRGAWTDEGNRGTAVLVGPQAAVLFDYKGPDNRFELLIRGEGESILYHRVGQRPAMTADGRRIGHPVGIRVHRDNERLDVSFDLLVGRADLREFGPAFEHYPRHIRLIGRSAIARTAWSQEPATRSATDPGISGTPQAQGPLPVSLRDVDPAWLFGSFAQTLPLLPGANPTTKPSFFSRRQRQ